MADGTINHLAGTEETKKVTKEKKVPPEVKSQYRKEKK
jgi:hypothetical protein